MVDSWELEFGGEQPQAMDRLLREVVDGQMAQHMSANQRAAAAWFRANGDRERAHTTGVFLKRSRVPGAAPVLGVYVDSHAMATDFGVNKDLYLARLANVGFAVSGIDFMPSRDGHRAPRKQSPSAAPQPSRELPALSSAEAQHARELVQALPEGLRDKALKAVTLSLQREKLERSQNRR